MEGRARPAPARGRYACLVPYVAHPVAILLADVTGATRASFFLTGLAAGAVWQLWHRRDLTSRLTFMSVVVTIGVVTSLVTGSRIVWADVDTVGLGTLGVLLGLIYAEHYQRWQDRVRRTSIDASIDVTSPRMNI